jgi:hypothetical protein
VAAAAALFLLHEVVGHRGQPRRGADGSGALETACPLDRAPSTRSRRRRAG